MPFAIVTAVPLLLAAALPSTPLPVSAAAPAPAAMALRDLRATTMLAGGTVTVEAMAPSIRVTMPLVGALALDAAVTAQDTTAPAATPSAPVSSPTATTPPAPETAPAAPPAAGVPADTTGPTPGTGTTTGAMLDAGAVPAATPVIRDPWEKTNRAIWGFNHTTDRFVLHPAAVVWTTVLPKFVRHHISLGLANLNEPITTLNDVFQLHMGRAARSLGRFVVNSTLGIAGLFDPATRGGLPAHPADFGQTLGRWGVHPGIYLVLPLFGPSDMRDGFGFAVDETMDPASWAFGGITSNFGIARDGAQIIDFRVSAQGTLDAIYDAPDPYSFARSAYIQRRIAVVLDATGQTAALPDFDTPGT